MALTKVTSNVLADEFFSSSAITTDVDWTASSVFTKTCTADTTITFSNIKTGMVKTLVIDGNYALTWPAGVKWLNGTYSGTATKNIIQLMSTDGSTEIFGTISNYTA
jgi:hypothetical protein